MAKTEVADAASSRGDKAPTTDPRQNRGAFPEQLTRMLMGAATGQNTGAAGVPEFVSQEGSRGKLLASACRAVNDSLPIHIDRDTRLRKCSIAPGQRVDFELELVNYDGPMIDLASFEVRYAAPLQRNICANRDVEILTKLGVSMLFRYRASHLRGERRLGDVFVNESVCMLSLRY